MALVKNVEAASSVEDFFALGAKLAGEAASSAEGDDASHLRRLYSLAGVEEGGAERDFFRSHFGEHI